MLFQTHNDVVRWNRICFIFDRIKARCEFVSQFHIPLQPFANQTNQIRLSTIVTMVSHLVLAKTNDSIDGAAAKTISRNLYKWKKRRPEKKFNKTKALQFRLSINSSEPDGNQLKNFSGMIRAGKISSAFGLLVELKSNVTPKTVKA